jgi:2',3'-cyclic-nucleotide 2'-phosphodiesterase
LRILFLGDVVGRSAREAVVKEIPEIRRNFSLDFVIVNGENAAGGFGITEKICEDFFSSGIDCITTGNHVWDQKELFEYIKDENRLLRPINYPEETPGKGFEIFPNQLGRVLVVNVMGRLFMESLDDPFNAIEKVLDKNPLGDTCDAIIIDIHAETTSEKTAMGHFCDGRVSLVVGTHTHIPTSDYQILPYGTAYQTDAGMCGDYDSVIGMEKTEPIRRFVEKTPGGRFNPAQGSPTLCGVIIETSSDGLSETIEPFRLGGILSQTKK